MGVLARHRCTEFAPIRLDLVVVTKSLLLTEPLLLLFGARPSRLDSARRAARRACRLALLGRRRSLADHDGGHREEWQECHER